MDFTRNICVIRQCKFKKVIGMGTINYGNLLDRLENPSNRAIFNYIMQIAYDNGFYCYLNVPDNISNKHSAHFYHTVEDLNKKSAKYSITLNRNSIKFYFRKRATQEHHYDIIKLIKDFGEINVSDNQLTSKGHEINILIYKLEEAHKLIEKYVWEWHKHK